MNPILLLAVLFAIVIVLLSTGLSVGISIALVGVAALFLFKGNAGLVPFIPFTCVNNFLLTAIPLFIFMGEVLLHCGASDMIYRGAGKWLTWAPGGLLHSNIGACALFAAVSGSSPATAATIGTVAYPELKRRHYDSRLSLGSLASGGTLGILIPPSITMIIYGWLAQASVGNLFAGGIIPGIILSVLYMIYIAIRVVRNPRLAPKEAAFSVKSAILGLKDLWPAIVIFIIVMGGIFGGLVTPTEAAALGASAALVMSLGLRKLTWQNLQESLLSSLKTTCMIFILVVGAFIFASLLSTMRVPEALVSLVEASDLPALVVLLLIYLLYLVLGCFIDVTSALIMTAGALLPVVTGLGFDIIWFGVVFVVLVEAGLLTPPMGINLFVIKGVSGEPLSEVVAGTLPFFGIMLLGIAIFTAFPATVLWLPNLLFGS